MCQRQSGAFVCACLLVTCNRQKDLEQFLEHTRAKFVGFQVKNDHTSLAGLPQPIHEGVKVLKQVICAPEKTGKMCEQIDWLTIDFKCHILVMWIISEARREGRQFRMNLSVS